MTRPEYRSTGTATVNTQARSAYRSAINRRPITNTGTAASETTNACNSFKAA